METNDVVKPIPKSHHPSIQTIDMGYALIYIDREGVLTEGYDDFFDEKMIEDYYRITNMQFNTYVIIAKEEVKLKKLPKDDEGNEESYESYLLRREEKIKEIQENDNYSRKYVIDRDLIDRFVEETFPPYNPESRGAITLVKANSWDNAEIMAYKVQQKELVKLLEHQELDLYPMLQPSWYRNYSTLTVLSELDLLRAKLLRNPNLNVIFYTHIRHELSFAKYKLNFLTPTYVESK